MLETEVFAAANSTCSRLVSWAFITTRWEPPAYRGGPESSGKKAILCSLEVVNSVICGMHARLVSQGTTHFR